MKTSVYYGKNDLRLEERAIPQIGEGDVLIKVDFCGLCGTDIKKILYDLGQAPSVLGHEITGTVVESRTDRFQIGDRIAVSHHVPCLDCHYCRHGNTSMCKQFKTSNVDPGGYSEYCRIPQRHVEQTSFKLERLSQEEGVFLEPLACIVRDLDRQNLQSGDLAICVGLGSIGLLSAQALAARAVTVIGLDPNEERLAVAKTLGVPRGLNPGRDRIRELVMDLSEGRGGDLVMVSAGGPDLLPQYLSWLRAGGTLNLFASLYPDTPAPLPVNELYHREIQVTTAYSASPEALAKAHALLESGQVKTRPLISKIYPLEELPRGIAQITAQEAIKVLINPGL